MKIAVVTFDGFNELDSFVASAILNRMKTPAFRAEIVCPTKSVTSMNGVKTVAQKPLAFANEADVVLFGSGMQTRVIAEDDSIMSQFDLNPERQLIGAQCSGSIFLKKLGLIENLPVCADTMTRPFLKEAGVKVLDQAFTANGNIASAGGCLASHYLAMWVIWHGAGLEAAKEVIHYVAPVGQKDEYVARAIDTVGPFFD